MFYNSTNLGAFEADGSCNVNSSEVLFEVRFNRIVDYDADTGLTPVFKNNSDSLLTGETNLSEESLVFTAYEVTNYFKEGKFTQRLSGTLRNFDTAVNAPANIAEEQNEVADTQVVTPSGVNTAPTKVTSSPSSTGLRPVNDALALAEIEKAQKRAEDMLMGVRTLTPAESAAQARLLQAQNNSAPQVPPKPGSTVVSDDAGFPTDLTNVI